MLLHSTRNTAFSRSWNDADHRVLFLNPEKVRQRRFGSHHHSGKRNNDACIPEESKHASSAFPKDGIPTRLLPNFKVQPAAVGSMNFQERSWAFRIKNESHGCTPPAKRSGTFPGTEHPRPAVTFTHEMSIA